MSRARPDAASVGTADADDTDIDRRLARLEALEASMSSLRHDLRGMLAPALLVADRLLAHPDPKVVRAGDTVVKSIRRAEARLQETRPTPPD